MNFYSKIREVNRLLSKEQWLLVFSAGFFLFFVLYFYEGFGIPKGISDTGHGLLFRAASFGVQASFLIFINEWLLRPYIKLKTFAHQLGWYCWELVVIWHFTYLLINLYWSWDSFSWFAYFDLLGELTSVMIIPYTLIEIYKRVRNKSLESSQISEKLIFEAENLRERVTIASDEFLYISSHDNYVDIFYQQNDEVKHKTLRSSLKQIEAAHSDNPAILRCHRSYIINADKVIHFTESSRNSKVELPKRIKIPVSKKYIALFKAR